MPMYTVQDPVSGRSVTIEGDAPPTEAELSEIFAAIPSATEELPEDPTLGERLSKTWETTAGKMRALKERAPEQTRASNILQFSGNVGSGLGSALFDIAAETGDYLVPDELGFGAAVSKKTANLMNTPVGKRLADLAKSGGEAWESFKKNYPETAYNIEGALGIAEVVPLGKGVSALESVGDVLIKRGKQLAKNKKGKWVSENLLIPEDTPSNRRAYADNYVNDTYKPTDRDLEVQASVTTKTEVSPDKSLGENKTAISEGIAKEANELQVKLEELQIPVDRGIYGPILNERLQNIRNMDLYIGSAESAEKVLQNHINKIKQLIEESDGTAAGMLEVRKKYDKWVDQWAPNDLTSDGVMSARKKIVLELRDGLNDSINQAAQGAGLDVKESLRHQSNLYRAKDVVTDKWVNDKKTLLGKLNKWARENAEGIALPASPLALGATIGYLGGGSLAVGAGVAGLGGVLYLTGKGVMSPRMKIYLGQVLKTIPKTMATERAIIVEAMKQPVTTEDGQEVNEEDYSTR